MGLALDYFYSLTPREFTNALRGFRAREQAHFRNSWEQVRQVMWASLAPYQKKGSQLKPQGIMQFEWEKTENEATLDDLKALRETVEQKNRVFWQRVDAAKIKA